MPARGVRDPTPSGQALGMGHGAHAAQPGPERHAR